MLNRITTMSTQLCCVYSPLQLAQQMLRLNATAVVVSKMPCQLIDILSTSNASALYAWDIQRQPHHNDCVVGDILSLKITQTWFGSLQLCVRYPARQLNRVAILHSLSYPTIIGNSIMHVSWLRWLNINIGQLIQLVVVVRKSNVCA